MTLLTPAQNCHPERSEGSAVGRSHHSFREVDGAAEAGSRFKRAHLILFALLMMSSICVACSWAVGYFHQVTALRGQIVAKNRGLVQLIRPTFKVSGAALVLYEYKHPARREELKRVAGVVTDSEGKFDFGPLPQGHYILFIQAGELEDRFDIEIIEAVRRTRNELIDISPVTPDCKGGHEFIETKL